MADPMAADFVRMPQDLQSGYIAYELDLDHHCQYMV